MISRFGLVKRKSGVSDEAFLTHWRDVHGPLAAKLPGLRAYYQHRIEDSRQLGVDHPRGAWDLDGFSELQFDSVEAMKAALAAPEFGPTVEDVAKFLDSVRLVVCEKNVVVPLAHGDGPFVKRMSLLKRHPHVSPQDFRREWLERHSEFVSKWPGVLGYTQNLVVDRYSAMAETAAYEAVPVDGIVEFWFRSKDEVASLFKSEQVAKTQEHAHSFIAEITTYFVETAKIA